MSPGCTWTPRAKVPVMISPMAVAGSTEEMRILPIKLPSRTRAFRNLAQLPVAPQDSERQSCRLGSPPGPFREHRLFQTLPLGAFFLLQAATNASEPLVICRTRKLFSRSALRVGDGRRRAELATHTGDAPGIGGCGFRLVELSSEEANLGFVSLNFACRSAFSLCTFTSLLPPLRGLGNFALLRARAASRALNSFSSALRRLGAVIGPPHRRRSTEGFYSRRV